MSGHLRRALNCVDWRWTIGWLAGYAAGYAIGSGHFLASLGIAVGLGGSSLGRWIERRLAYRIEISVSSGTLSISSRQPVDAEDIRRRFEERQ